MIMQLKVTLKGTTPPIWRRLLQDGETTFHQLHEVLQAAFDWDDFRMHCFDIRTSRGQRVDSLLSIGLQDDAPDYAFDERTEKVGKWIIAEKDRAVYTYDFILDWEVEIILEKLIPVDMKLNFPHCVKAAWVAPGEVTKNSPYFSEPEEVDSKELADKINNILHPH